MIIDDDFEIGEICIYSCLERAFHSDPLSFD